MLKLTYTENGLHIERLTCSVEQFAENRLLLSLRSGQPFYTVKSHASLLLLADIPDLSLLEAGGRCEQAGAMLLEPVDRHYIEVSLTGTWIATDAHVEEGIFAVTLGDDAEAHLYELWQQSESRFAFST